MGTKHVGDYGDTAFDFAVLGQTTYKRTKDDTDTSVAHTKATIADALTHVWGKPNGGSNSEGCPACQQLVYDMRAIRRAIIGAGTSSAKVNINAIKATIGLMNRNSLRKHSAP